MEIDEKNATHYFELAAMNGDIKARYNLGGLDTMKAIIKEHSNTTCLRQELDTKILWAWLRMDLRLGKLQKRNTQTRYENTKRVKMRGRAMRGIKQGHFTRCLDDVIALQLALIHVLPYF